MSMMEALELAENRFMNPPKRKESTMGIEALKNRVGILLEEKKQLIEEIKQEIKNSDVMSIIELSSLIDDLDGESHRLLFALFCADGMPWGFDSWKREKWKTIQEQHKAEHICSDVHMIYDECHNSCIYYNDCPFKNN